MSKISHYFQRKVSDLKISDVTLVSAFLCAVIFGFGYVFGQANLDSKKSDVNKIEHLKIIIPPFSALFVAGFFSFFIKNYVEDKVKNAQTNNSVLLLDNEIARNIRESQDLEFICMLREANINLGNINFKGLSSCIEEQGLKNREEKVFLTKLEEHKEDTKAHEDVIKALSEHLATTDGNVSKLVPLVLEACNIALKRKPGDKITDEIQCFRGDIYAYLKAWLLCSIKYRIPIPVHPFKRTDLDTRVYVDAIKFIQRKALQDEAILELFPSPRSRKIVRDYLKELIRLLESDQSSNTVSLI